MDKKKLCRSGSSKMLCGVCGGVAEYFNIDPTVVRLIWAVLSITSVGMGALVYIVAAIIMPE
jgi:phage shock protein C